MPDHVSCNAAQKQPVQSCFAESAHNNDIHFIFFCIPDKFICRMSFKQDRLYIDSFPSLLFLLHNLQPVALLFSTPHAFFPSQNPQPSKKSIQWIPHKLRKPSLHSIGQVLFPLFAASLEQTEPSVAIIIFLKLTFPMQNPNYFIFLQEI